MARYAAGVAKDGPAAAYPVGLFSSSQHTKEKTSFLIPCPIRHVKGGVQNTNHGVGVEADMHEVSGVRANLPSRGHTYPIDMVGKSSAHSVLANEGSPYAQVNQQPGPAGNVALDEDNEAERLVEGDDPRTDPIGANEGVEACQHKWCRRRDAASLTPGLWYRNCRC
jgi:hypothetical protein